MIWVEIPRSETDTLLPAPYFNYLLADWGSSSTIFFKGAVFQINGFGLNISLELRRSCLSVWRYGFRRRELRAGNVPAKPVLREVSGPDSGFDCASINSQDLNKSAQSANYKRDQSIIF